MKLLHVGLFSIGLISSHEVSARLNTGPVGSDEVPRQLQQLPGGCETFITSGYDLENPGSVGFYTNTTFITLAQAGTYIGADAVFEYVLFASPNSPFVSSDDVLLRSPQFVGYAPDPKTNDDTPLCQFTTGLLQNTQLQGPYANDGNLIFERTTFVKFFWDPVSQKVDHIYILYDDDFLEYFFQQLDTVASASLVCGVYTQACPGFLDPLDFTECVGELGGLPLVQQEVYIDGNSKGCRFLHAVFAASSLGAAALHCPHISFTPVEDPKGFIKCQDETAVRLASSDLFTESDFAIWESFKATVFGFFRDNSLQVVGNVETGVLCERGYRLVNNKCKKLCKGGAKLGIDSAISASVPVCIPNN